MGTTANNNERVKTFGVRRKNPSLMKGSLWLANNCYNDNARSFWLVRVTIIICFVGISFYVSQQVIPSFHRTQHDDYRYEPNTGRSIREQHHMDTKNNDNNAIPHPHPVQNHNTSPADPLETNSKIMIDREEYYKNMKNGLSIGVLSKQPIAFFRKIQNEIDDEDNTIRCNRYGAYYNSSNRKNRRIFYGALIASEPWEVFEIVSAETYGIYSAMVYVEGNRTQNFTPRKFLRSEPKHRQRYIETIQELFNVTAVQIRQFVQEDNQLVELNREHYQRAEIIKGWKELGMTVHDIGLLADTDETFTRDFLRAVQVCDGFDILDYIQHYCYYKMVKITSAARVFESSPECITQYREWRHPDMIIGHCIEGINTDRNHPPAPRGDDSTTTTGELYPYLRQSGYGRKCRDWYLDDNTNFTNHTLWNAADFRRPCGGRIYHVKNTTMVISNERRIQLDYYTGYHFHNFFSDFNETRFKYYTYGHADLNVNIKPIYNISNNLNMMYQCIKNNTPTIKQFWKHTVGGYNAIKPFYPIYFHDPDYRYRRHQHVQKMVYHDEILLNNLLQKSKNKSDF